MARKTEDVIAQLVREKNEALSRAEEAEFKLDTRTKALRYLRNEAAGAVGAPGIRELIGNSNVACLEQRIKEAEEALNE